MRRFAYTLVVLPALLLISTVSALQTDQETKTLKEVVTIPYEVKYVFDRDMGAGRLQKVQHGVDGQFVREFAVSYKDGKEIGRVLVKEEKTPSVPAVFHMGKPSNRAVSRGTYTRAKVVTMESTAYLPSAGLKNPTYKTRTGTKAEYGAIAVDPKVIPLGTLMYVEGYGFGIAEDTGGAIKGNKIDVCIENRRQAYAWGRRTVKVHIFTKHIEIPVEEEKPKADKKG
jgi:3D (Asp-Asp-Asp) domain-containing protein